jgi:hypothetical protein
VKTFALSLALLLAGCAGMSVRAESVRMIDEAPAPVGTRLVYDIDPQCANEPIGYTLPRTETAACWQTAARDYLKAQVLALRISPGPRWLCGRYIPSEWSSCVEMVFRPLPEIRYGVSAQWVTGTIGGQQWNGCAAGQARSGYLFVYLGEPARVLPLVAHETANHFLAYVMDMLADGDGPITSDAVAYARRECGD